MSWILGGHRGGVGVPVGDNSTVDVVAFISSSSESSLRTSDYTVYTINEWARRQEMQWVEKTLLTSWACCLWRAV